MSIEILNVALMIFGAKIRMVPVPGGVVKTKAEVCFMAGLGEFADDIAAVGRLGAGYFIIGQLGIEHAETIVVLGGKDQVFHPCVAGNLNPFIGVEFYRVELLIEIIINFDGDTFGISFGSMTAAPLVTRQTTGQVYTTLGLGLF